MNAAPFICQLLLEKQLVGMPNTTTVIHEIGCLGRWRSCIDRTIVAHHKTVVTLALQVVLDFDLPFILRLVLDDGEELFTALALLARQAGPTTRITDAGTGR